MKSTQLDAGSFKFISSSIAPAGFGVALLMFALIAFAAEQNIAVESPDWLQLALGLFGGLALFLGGLQQLSDGMKKAAGHSLTNVLG